MALQSLGLKRGRGFSSVVYQSTLAKVSFSRMCNSTNSDLRAKFRFLKFVSFFCFCSILLFFSPPRDQNLAWFESHCTSRTVRIRLN